ncbi:MAG: HAD family hydrolase [Desulfurococcaceae archaeon]
MCYVNGTSIGSCIQKQRLIVFVDLDGTIVDTSINNTYDFIKFYFRSQKKYFKLLLYKILFKIFPIISVVINLTHLNKIISIDGIFTTLLFIGCKVHSLEEFAINWINFLNQKSLFNEEVLELINYFKRNGAKVYLLTACTELPAKLLGEHLRFDGILSRRFIIKKGIILGVRDLESISQLKLKYIRKIKGIVLEKSFIIYIVDEVSASLELRKLSNLIDIVIIIGGN